MDSTTGRPILWQLQISHYNEKVRWALDHKRIDHVRRSLLPGFHVLVARRLTGGQTTPILTLDGQSVRDSTAIIAALERRWPDRPLYPSDPSQRARALELEEFFDEQVGPDVRRAVYHVLLERPDLVVPLFAHGQPWPARTIPRLVFGPMSAAMRRAMTIEPEAAARSRERTVAALARLESELGPGGYLVGDSFTVADLTAASLLYPLVLPSEYPYPTLAKSDIPADGREFLDSLADRPSLRWVSEVYARHRAPMGTVVIRHRGRAVSR